MSASKELYKLWQHRNGTIYVVWTDASSKAGEPSSYQSRRISTRSTDWREAEQFRSQFIAGLNNAPPPPNVSIGYLLERYRTERAPHARSPETMTASINMLMPFFGDLLPQHVTNLLLRQFAEKHRHLSAGTILRRLGVLKAALRYAEGNRWIEPLPPIRMPVGHPPPRDIWLTREQVSILIEKAKSPHIRLFIKLAVTTAARSGAILDLKWSQVDLQNQIIDFGRGWGNKRRAVVPINEDASEALLEAQELALSDHVIEFNGKPLKSIKIAFRRLCVACGIEASPHALRHTAATWMVMDGVPLSEVARLLGNSEAMIEKVYGKHSPDYLRRAVTSLNIGRNRQAPQL